MSKPYESEDAYARRKQVDGIVEHVDASGNIVEVEIPCIVCGLVTAGERCHEHAGAER